MLFSDFIDEAARQILAQQEFPANKEKEIIDEIRKSGERDNGTDEYHFHGLIGKEPNPLGDYEPMSSLGLIRLYIEPIGVLYRAAIGALRLNESDDEDSSIRYNICRFIISKTYFHEQLHFMWDLAKSEKWPGATHNKNNDMEEALATAWGWYCSQAYGRQLGISVDQIEAVTRFCFDGIDLQGYRDWKNLAHYCFFESDFASYFDLEYSTISPEPDPRDRLNDFLRLVLYRAKLCNYKILDRKGGHELAAFNGDSCAFPEFIKTEVLSASGTYYPIRHCDLRAKCLDSPEVINLVTNAYFDVEDYFICGRNTAPDLHYIHKNITTANRICLRHTKLDSPMLSLYKIKPNSKDRLIVYFDQPIQKLWDTNNNDITELQQALIDDGEVDDVLAQL